MLVLTDGQSGNETLTVGAARNAIASFSVGILNNMNEIELLEIAGGDTNRVFTTDNFEEVIELLAPINLGTCSND